MKDSLGYKIVSFNTKHDARTIIDAVKSRMEHRQIHHVLIHSWFPTTTDNFLDVQTSSLVRQDSICWYVSYRMFKERAVASTAGLSTLLESMHTIRKVSTELLQEKMNDSVAVSDTDAKRDIMSILVRARKADLEKDKTIYTMSDKAMIDQVVSIAIIDDNDILSKKKSVNISRCGPRDFCVGVGMGKSKLVLTQNLI